MQILTQTATAMSIITLDEAKAHLRVEHTDEDVLIATLCDTATQIIDGEGGLCGYCVASQNWLYKSHNQWTYDCFGNVIYKLPKTPVKALVSIKYYNASNALITENIADWSLISNGETAYIMPNDGLLRTEFKRVDSFQVEFTSGLVNIPAELKHAALLIISALYDNRGDEGFQIPAAVQNLVNLKRRGWVG